MLTAALLSLLLSASAARTPAPYPPPDAPALTSLIRWHHASRWMRVTLADARVELRARRLDGEGLHGLETRNAVADIADPLPWNRIARIDQPRDMRLRGAVIGGISIGLTGALMGTIVGDVNSHDPRNGFLVGALVGVVAGRRIGGSGARESPVYVARRPEGDAPPLAIAATEHDVTADAAQPAAADTARDESGPPPESPRSALDSAAPSEPVPTPDARRIAKACPRIASGHLVRVRTDAGMFVGYVGVADSSGLSSLRLEPGRRSPLPAEDLRWPDIQRVEVLVSGAREGAIAGGVGLGIVGGVGTLLVLLAAEGVTGGDVPDRDKLIWPLAGAGVGAGLGVLVGGTLGWAVPFWRMVYRAPHPARVTPPRRTLVAPR